MTADLEAVRAILGASEDVSLPEDMATAPHPDHDAAHPDEDPFRGMEPDHDFGPALAAGGEDAEKLRRASGFPINDLGNAQRFILHFGEDLMFVPRVGWHVWDGNVWQVDPDMIATRRKAQRLCELVMAEVPYLLLSEDKMQMMAEERALKMEREALEGQTDEEGRLPDEAKRRLDRVKQELSAIDGLKVTLSKLRTGHRTFARSTGNSAKVKAAITEAEVELAVRVEDLNTQHLDVNTIGAVLRFDMAPDFSGIGLSARVQVLPPERGFRMTKMVQAEFDASATAPIFDAFLARIMPDAAMRDFLQRWFGYSMLGLTNEQALAFFYGMGANGKSALMDLMARIMGSYAATAKIESLTGQNRRSGGDATPDLINIVGARFVRTSEPERGVQWQEGLIKQLTGGEPILVRDLNEKFFEAEPRFKLTIGGNHAPDIRGMDDGIWRRLMIVPFDVQIPKEERDPLLVQKMMVEAPGILNWLIEGVKAYLDGGLRPPAQVTQATDTLRSDSDPYGRFLDEACIVTGNAEDNLTSRELMLSFAFWQMMRGETPFKDRTISMNMKDHSRRWRSPKTGKQFSARETGRFNGYDGLRWTDFFKREWENAPKDQHGRALAVAQGYDDAPMAGEF